MKCFSFLLLLQSSFFITNLVWATPDPIAKVVKIRGTVTKLLPGAIEASVVNLGDELVEDTSLVTGSKSFVQLKFIDNSILSMGPVTKVVVNDMKPGKPGIITLLKGRIRTEVEKNHSSEKTSPDKFYIRTRTAAMGVRGTDFQTIYNPENHVTSLLTFKGSVAIAKIDEATHEIFEPSRSVVSRSESSNDPLISQVEGAPVDEENQLKKLFKKNHSVLVLAGQNSFTSNHMAKMSLPVKISPAQFNALFKNKELNEKNILNLNSAKIVSGIKPLTQTIDQEAPVEGFHNQGSDEFAPRAGGFLDLGTGLYIAPESSSSFDSKNNVYLSLNTGDVDSDTGEYFPPSQLYLEPQSGFQAVNVESSRVEILAKRDDLNTSLSKEIVLGRLDNEFKKKNKDRDEKFIRNYLSLGISLGSYHAQFNKNAINPYVDGQNSSAKKFKMDYQFSSKNRLTTQIGLAFSKTSYDLVGSQQLSKNTSSLWKISAGIVYAVTSDFDLAFKVNLDQKDVGEISSTTPFEIQISKSVLTTLNLSGHYNFYKHDDIEVTGGLAGSFAFRKKYNNLIINNFKAYAISINPQYKLDEKKSLGLNLSMQYDFYDASNVLGLNKVEHSEQAVELLYRIAM